MFKQIKTKITVLLFLLMLSMSFILHFIIFEKVKEHSLNVTQEHILMLEQSIFQNLREKMNTGINQDLQDVIHKANEISGIEKLHIYKNKQLFDIKEMYPLEIEKTFQYKQKNQNEYNIADEHFLQITTPIIANNECLVCHVNVKENDVLGVFDFHYNFNQTKDSIETFIFELKIISIILGFFVIFIIYLIVKKTLLPMEELKDGFNALLDDNIDSSKLESKSNDEIGEIVHLFNQYLEKLDKDLKEDAKHFADNIINSQTNIIFASNSDDEIISVNNSFLDFFGVENIKEFNIKHGFNLDNLFLESPLPNFIKRENNGFYWFEYVLQNKHKNLNAMLAKNNKNHIFHISVNNFTIGLETYKTTVLTDITAIEEAKQKFKMLLDNSQQGFLYFDIDMKIGHEYSKKASEIFGLDLFDKDITYLLYPQNKEEAFGLCTTLQSLLKLDSIRQEMIFELLQTKFILNNKTIEVEYKFLNNKEYLLILTDITKQEAMQKKELKDKQILKMVVETVTTLEQFEEIRIAFEAFTKNIESYKSLEKLPELRREIHTYKGLFAQKEMLHIVQHLHDFESLIDVSLKEQKIEPTIIHTTGKIVYSWLEDDIKILKNILGSEFFHKSEYLNIKQERVEEIHKQLLLIDGIEEIKEKVKHLLYKDIQVYIKPYKHIVDNLSKKLDKPINAFEINADNIFVPSKYKNFLNNLVHIFRNALDHGIESQEIRKEKNKPLMATINCSIKILDKNLQITISDDGKGLDIEKIKDKIIEKSLVSSEVISTLDENKIIEYIWEDSFSTTNTITQTSGRGVGLASLKSEIEILKGNIEVINEKDIGCTFIFTLPFTE